MGWELFNTSLLPIITIVFDNNVVSNDNNAREHDNDDNAISSTK